MDSGYTSLASTDLKPAGFLVRASAAYLNTLIIGVMIFLITIPLLGLETLKSLAGSSADPNNILYILGITVLLIILNDVILQGLLGANIGKAILGLKVLDCNSLGKIGFFRGISRSFCYLISVLLFGIGVLVIPFSKRKRSLHDVINNSCVVYDNHPLLIKPLRAFLHLVMAISFLLSLVIFPAVFGSTVYLSYKNYKFGKAINFIESKVFELNPQAAFTVKAAPQTGIPSSICLKERHPGDISFTVDAEQDANFITEESLKKLGVEFKDYKFHVAQINDKWKLVKKVLIEKMSIKDINGQSLIVENIGFSVSRKANSLGKDFLNIFDAKQNGDSLSLKIKTEEQKLFASKGIGKISRAHMRSIIARLGELWQAALAEMPYELLEGLKSQKTKLSNPTKITFEADRGNIVAIKFLKPTENTQFNQFCQQFLKQVPRFKELPQELKSQRKFSIEYDLDFNPNSSER